MPKIIAQAKVAALKALIKARIKANKEDKEKGKKVRSLIRSLGGGNGLVVRITSNTAYYQIRYSWKGKPKFFTIGKTDLISYPNAKKKCLEYRRMVFNGQDPAIVNKQKKIEEKAVNNQNITKHPFWQVCDEYLIFREESGAFKHSSKGKSDFSAMMVTYAYPVIQNKDIAEITSDDILKILQDPYVNKPAMAQKLKSHLKGVLNLFKVKNYRTDENPVTSDSLEVVLKSLNPKKKQPSHNAALDYREIPKLIKACFDKHTVPAYELIFSILTASRSKAVRLMKWAEINYKDKSWTIPLENDKIKKEQANRTIYLSKAAIQLLKWIDKRSEYVFVSKLCKTYTDSVFKSVIYQLNEDHIRFNTPIFVDRSIIDPKTKKPAVITQHGTARASFKSWASADENAKKRYNVDAVEMCMLHERKDPLKGAYDRTKHVSERRRIMEDWGNYCVSLISDKFWDK